MRWGYLFLVFFGHASCVSQGFGVKPKEDKLYLLENKEIIDSVALFSPDYSKHAIIGNTLYYTDGISTPDRVYIRLFKVGAGDLRHTSNIPIKSLYLEREQFQRLRFRSDHIILHYIDEGHKKKIKYRLDSLFEGRNR